jgi:hypothetical protein
LPAAIHYPRNGAAGKWLTVWQTFPHNKQPPVMIRRLFVFSNASSQAVYEAGQP